MRPSNLLSPLKAALASEQDVGDDDAHPYSETKAQEQSKGRERDQFPRDLAHSISMPTFSPDRASMVDSKLAETITKKKAKLMDALTRSAEVAATVMQAQRLSSLSSQKITLASLSTVDNYDSSGKRRNKPTNIVERRKEPDAVAAANRDSKEEIRVYLESGAVEKDKYFLKSVMPGVRKENIIDASVSQYADEMKQPASQIFSQGTSQYTMTDGSMTNTTNGINVKTKKYKRLKLERSDTGQPHDPARFDGAKHRKKDVPQGPEKKGFGILGGHIEIKDHDPRIRPKAAARAVSALQGVGVSLELQMGSLEQLPDGGILGADG